MHAKYVIHAVGPIWKNGKSGEVEALQSCVTGSINMTNTTLKQDSLSIPAISSGIFGFPKDLCAKLMIESALEYFKTSESTEKNLKMIRLCNFDKPTVTYFVTAFDKIFGTSDQKPQISQAEIEPTQEEAQEDQMQDSQQQT
jgi:putative ATPase